MTNKRKRPKGRQPKPNQEPSQHAAPASRGVVKTWALDGEKKSKGFGFILMEDGSSIFCHKTAIVDGNARQREGRDDKQAGRKQPGGTRWVGKHWTDRVGRKLHGRDREVARKKLFETGAGPQCLARRRSNDQKFGWVIEF